MEVTTDPAIRDLVFWSFIVGVGVGLLICLTLFVFYRDRMLADLREQERRLGFLVGWRRRAESITVMRGTAGTGGRVALQKDERV